MMKKIILFTLSIMLQMSSLLAQSNEVYYQLISYGDSLLVLKTTTITINEHINDTVVIYGSPVDSSTMIQQVFSAAVQENMKHAGYLRRAAEYRQTSGSWNAYASLIDQLDTLTLLEKSALHYKQLFEGEWLIRKAQDIDVTISYDNENKVLVASNGAQEWTIDIMSQNEIIIKAFQGQDRRLIRFSDSNSNIEYRSPTWVLPPGLGVSDDILLRKK